MASEIEGVQLPMFELPAPPPPPPAVDPEPIKRRPPRKRPAGGDA